MVKVHSSLWLECNLNAISDVSHCAHMKISREVYLSWMMNDFWLFGKNLERFICYIELVYRTFSLLSDIYSDAEQQSEFLNFNSFIMRS